MTAFLNPWVILSLVLAIAGAFGGGYYKGNSAGQAEVQQKWDKEKTEQYAEYAAAQEAARAREQNLQIQADRLREDKDREIRNLNARATALSNSLRDRGRSAPPKMVPCPVPPDLALEPPVRNWQKEMENFLQGTVPTQPVSKQPSTSASSNTTPQDKR